MPKRKKEKKEKWNAAVLCFPLEFYVEVCLHNEKYACILYSFVFKRFGVGMPMLWSLRNTPLLVQRRGGLEEGLWCDKKWMVYIFITMLNELSHI